MSASQNSTDEVSQLKQQIVKLQMELDDLQLLYETTMEHGTSLENELILQNERITELQGKMRKYLSPQLYQALVGGQADTSTTFHKRTKLTVYFSDIVGFSSLTDSIEPELLSEVLNTYLTRMSEIALKYGGTIDKFIGDAVMVFFGAPEPMDDTEQAKLAVQMALDMRQALYELREGWKRKGINRLLQIRAGINTGICTVGNFGSEHRMDYTIVGGQVNIAARLESAADADGIYISSQTYALVEDVVEAKYIGPTQMKGIHEPVIIWELIGMRENSSAVQEFLNIDGTAMTLNPIEIDLTTLSEEKRDAIRRALSRAMTYLAS